ncbi:hypothetical protein K1T71_005732 [Dendrolimus kikuchii]|uniref:Uncharacterized protein n=1 Tax=Dendrolimus kikuchii TaxID=765133 RepID=A0ACC1D6D3_9NEOP|nr:hypothetical protein K1T71_005732 [Dendrolimus kikuchii]
MDVSFNNVLEGTRQYFMGVPKQALAEGSGQPVWPADAPPPEEGTPAQSGAPAPSSRPPSAAAAPPPAPATPVAMPPRPPSEPLEPEPHIIHKATVMREAAEKRREMPEIDDEEEAAGTLSPPSHIIRKPSRALPSPAPAPAAPSPSPARPPSEAPVPPTPVPDPQPEPSSQYRPPVQRVRTPSARPPDPFAPVRPPDPYPTNRPSEQYPRYHYEQSVADNSKSHHGPVPSPQPSMPMRHSPTTYARMSSTMPQHTAARLREAAAQSPPSQRYVMPPAQPPPPHNDRVPPIHHPQTPLSTQRISSGDSRSAPVYSALQHRQDSSYVRTPAHYDRHSTAPPRKYDQQQMYPGYRPGHLASQPVPNNRLDTHHQIQYKHSAMDVLNSHYAGRATDRSPVPPPPHPHDAARLQTRPDYPNMGRPVSSRSSYPYQAPSTSSSRYGPSVPVPVVQNPVAQSRSDYRPVTAPKSNYNYTPPSSVQTSPGRSVLKPGYPSQQARMTVSVTSLVNEMIQTKQKRESSNSGPPLVNQTNSVKQKRESPLDLSVKTVKNSADSSTTQDDVVDSMSVESKPLPLQPRPSSSTGRHSHLPQVTYVASHKVDFAPNFTQYGERSTTHPSFSTSTPANNASVRYNGSYDTRRPIAEPYSAETCLQVYPNRGKYSTPGSRPEYPKIDLTRTVGEQRLPDSRIRDDRHYIIEERKRPAGPIDSNIPEKILRYETWTADSRIEHMAQSAREQRELMSRPVYSYSSHKQFEAYRHEQQRHTPNSVYRDHHVQAKHTYPTSSYTAEIPLRDSNDYHARYHDRNPSISRNVIQKLPSHRDIHPNHLDPHSGVPADKRVLSILRTSLETKQSGFVESPRLSKQIPDLIVIDDVDDSVIEITDLTNENDIEKHVKCVTKPSLNTPSLNNHIQMPKAVDSIVRDSDYQKYDSYETKMTTPENDVASRIRTKAELKVMPPSQDHVGKADNNQSTTNESETANKILPKSQKQHLFNQIREDNLRLESVIKSENPLATIIPELKTEPMNIDEIERDAAMSIKSESILDNIDENELLSSITPPPEDLDWANACDSFMEQLKTGVHKKKTHRKRISTLEFENENKVDPIKTPKTETVDSVMENQVDNLIPAITIKQEPIDTDEIKAENESQHQNVVEETVQLVNRTENKNDQNKTDRKNDKYYGKTSKMKTKTKEKSEKNESSTSTTYSKKEKNPIKTVIKEELESTDDDEPLIKSKILKDKSKNELLNSKDIELERNERLKYQLLKDLSEKSAYVKLECCDVDLNKNNRKSIDTASGKNKEDKLLKGKSTRQLSRSKGKSLSTDTNKIEKTPESSTDSDDEVTVATRLRVRKNVKSEDKDNKGNPIVKTPIKSSPSKKGETSSSASNSSTPVRKPGFGDGSDFHPGWEEELYRYKRSLRMPTRLIAIPRGRSGGPFVRGSSALFTRGSTSLPDLDPAPLSPAPSSAPSAATDDLYARRQDKLILDSDLDSNSSCSAPNRLHYDSEASTSTVFSSSKVKRKGSSIVDVLIQKCGTKKEESKKKSKEKDEKLPKVIPKNSNTNELLPTPSLGLLKNGKQGGLSAKKEKLMEDIFYLGAFRKETVTMFRNAFIKNTDGLIGPTEEFSPVVLKTRTRTESRVLKQRATIKEVFGDERPASAPPTSCRNEEVEEKDEPVKEIKKETLDAKPSPTRQFKPKKLVKNKLQRRSSSIRDGLRSTKSLKRNDAKGRLLRLKKRNSLIKSLKNKRIKEISNKHKIDSNLTSENKEKTKEEGCSVQGAEVTTKRRLKRLVGRRKFSSGFDYIRKKKKIIRKEDSVHKVRRPAAKPNPESVHDIHKEIKGWFINKSIGETHLHRAARLGYTDCVAYCLEKMESDPSAKDNAGFTPLHVAAAKGYVRIARLLLQYGANVSAAAQGGIRPLHEACENCHVEVIRLLLAYGADPLLGTYAGQTPEELTEGIAAKFLRLHIADVQGRAIKPWKFPPLIEIIDREELGCDPLASPPPASPPPPPDSMMEIQCTDAPLPPFYSLKSGAGLPIDGLWCLLQDITNLLQIKSKESLLKQIHCGSGSPKELLREIRTQEFLERAQCHQLLSAGEKVNPRASKVALVRVTDKLRQLLKIETVLVS